MANFGQGALGALGGAASGATLGSVIPGIGTAIGAGVGGLAGGLTGLFSKNKKPFQETPNKFNPQQQQALMQLLSQGQAGLQNPTAGFQPIEDYARSKFQRESIPGLAERFTSLGGSDTRGSSDFAGMLGGAQSEFDQGLAALRAQYGQQGQQNALQLLQTGLQPQTDQMYMGEQQGIGDQIAEMGGNALGTYLGGGGDFGLGASSAGNVGGLFSKWTPQQKSALLNALRQWKSSQGGI